MSHEQDMNWFITSKVVKPELKYIQMAEKVFHSFLVLEVLAGEILTESVLVKGWNIQTLPQGLS